MADNIVNERQCVAMNVHRFLLEINGNDWQVKSVGEEGIFQPSLFVTVQLCWLSSLASLAGLTDNIQLCWLHFLASSAGLQELPVKLLRGLVGVRGVVASGPAVDSLSLTLFRRLSSLFLHSSLNL